MGVDPSTIATTPRVLLVTEADDLDPNGTRAVARIWAGLESVPRENRDVVQLVTDGYGRPALLATHTQALADLDRNPPDAFNWYGTWMLLDGLMGCAFDGEWCKVALGNAPRAALHGHLE
jgi:hypothetical protein